MHEIYKNIKYTYVHLRVGLLYQFIFIKNELLRTMIMSVYLTFSLQTSVKFFPNVILYVS